MESNHFRESPEFVEKYSNFETLTQQHVRNNTVQVYLRMEIIYTFLHHTHFLKKMYGDK